LHGEQVLLAPLRQCDFSMRKKPKEKWDYIKRIGTSLAEPARIYLTKDPDLGFERRFIDLSAKFHHTPEDLRHFIEADHRVATLTDRGLINLQHRLTVQLTRVAREDLDWLSEDDLDIKVQALTEEVEGKKKALHTKEGQFAKAKPGPEKEDLEADIEVAKDQLADLEYELRVARESLELVAKERRQVSVMPSVVINGSPTMSPVEKLTVLQNGGLPSGTEMSDGLTSQMPVELTAPPVEALAIKKDTPVIAEPIQPAIPEERGAQGE